MNTSREKDNILDELLENSVYMLNSRKVLDVRRALSKLSYEHLASLKLLLAIKMQDETPTIPNTLMVTMTQDEAWSVIRANAGQESDSGPLSWISERVFKKLAELNPDLLEVTP